MEALHISTALFDLLALTSANSSILLLVLEVLLCAPVDLLGCLPPQPSLIKLMNFGSICCLLALKLCTV